MNSIVSVVSVFLGAGFLAVAALGACSDGSSGSSSPSPTATVKPEGDATAKTPVPTPIVDATTVPIVTGPAALSATYAKNCVGCHGAEGQGLGNFPKLTGTQLSQDAWLEILMNGRGIMPPFSKNGVLTLNIEDVLADFAVFSRPATPVGTPAATPVPEITPVATPVPAVTPSFTPEPAVTPAATPQPTPVATATSLPVPAPLALSAEYAKFCASCHTKKGEGISGFSPRLIGTTLTSEQYLKVVREGRGSMPPIGAASISDDSVLNDHAFFSSTR